MKKRDVEKFRAEDKFRAENVQNKFEAGAKEQLEKAVKDEFEAKQDELEGVVAEKFRDKEQVEEAVQERMDWLDDCQLSEKDKHMLARALFRARSLFLDCDNSSVWTT